MLLVAVSAGAFIVRTGIQNQQKTTTIGIATDLSQYFQSSSTAVFANGKSISSSLGFKVTYDDTSLKARGQVTDLKSTDTYIFGESFEGDELKDERDYSILKFEAATKDDNSSLYFERAQLNISTNIRDEYFTTKEALPENDGKSKLQLLIDTVSTSVMKDASSTVASEATSVKINGIQYKKIRYTTTYTVLGQVTSQYYSEYYFTVQNDRPYWAAMLNIRESNNDIVSQFESVIGTLSYTSKDGSAASGDPIATSSDILTIATGSSYVPQPIDDQTILSVVARNQPAVVRVGTTYCADVNLLNKNNDSVVTSIKNVCTAGTGSGSIVSSDGYIATNGHVTRVTVGVGIGAYVRLPSSFDDASEASSRAITITNYYVTTGQIERGSADTLIAKIKKGDREALSIANELAANIPADLLQATAERYTYGIQLSNNPLRLAYDSATGAISFIYNDTIISANYIDSNFNNSGPPRLNPQSFGSDVSILKMSGDFPTVKLGSVDDIALDSQLTALGFPAFVDGGLTTKQDTTVPSVTQGKALKLTYTPADREHLLIFTSVPISGGNSGGPAFTNDGFQIGLNTYGAMKCPDKQCFGNGVVRDVKDFQTLLRKNNISIKQNGKVSKLWNEGVDALAQSDYSTANKAFRESSEAYPANYLAKSLMEFTEPYATSASESTSSNILLLIAIITLGGGVAVGVSIPVVLVVKRNKRNQGTPQQPQAPIQQPVTTPIQPPVQPPVQPTNTPFNPFANNDDLPPRL